MFPHVSPMVPPYEEGPRGACSDWRKLCVVGRVKRVKHVSP